MQNKLKMVSVVFMIVIVGISLAKPLFAFDLPHNERINLYTDALWTYNTGHQSDLIRLHWLNNTAKPAITWYNETGKATAAIVGHDYLAYPSNRHRHISIETINRTDNSLHSRFECLWGYDDGNDGGYCGVASGYNFKVGSGGDLMIVDGDLTHQGSLDIFPNAKTNQAVGLRIATTSTDTLLLAGLGTSFVHLADNLNISGLLSSNRGIIATSPGTASVAADRGSTAGYANFFLRNGGVDQWALQLRNNTGQDLHLRDVKNGQTVLRAIQNGNLLFNPVGNVGVGTQAPSAKLHLHHPSATVTLYLDSGASGKGGRIVMEDRDGAGCTELTTLNGVLSTAVVPCL